MLHPFAGDHARDAHVQRLTTAVERLQVGAARVARATQRDHGAPEREVRHDRVASEIRVDGDGMRAVPGERLTRVVLGRRPDVAALGVEDQRDVRILLADVGAEPLELGFGALRREERDLWLERADEVGGGVDDRPAELPDRVGAGLEDGGHPGRIRVETDAHHRSRRGPAALQLVVEAHGADGTSVS